jgi:hypothetical protein
MKGGENGICDTCIPQDQNFDSDAACTVMSPKSAKLKKSKRERANKNNTTASTLKYTRPITIITLFFLLSDKV